MADGSDGGNGAGLVGDRELRICTVRIDVRGAPAGSGFFIAPGQVVTCAHVLQALDLSAPGAVDAITVSDVENNAYGVESVPSLWSDDDLAVLRVAPAYRHPCVLSIRGVRMFDRFVTFGYPQEHREGLARALRSESTTGDERLQAFAAGQVQPGMSGAPVLNTRTGGVCGVLSATRNEALDLGGYAIPIEKLFLRSPTLERLNRGYHEAYRDWFDKLPPEQKSVLLDARRGAFSSGSFTSVFVVSLGREENDWAVSATLHPGGHVGPEEVDLNSVREKVARLFRDWASRGRAEPGEVAPGRFDPGEEVRLLGGILFSAVLPGAIGRRFEEVLPEGDERVLLALHFKRGLQPAIVEMPWEHLYLPQPGVESDVHVARADKLAFVRVLSPERREPERPSMRHLSALMVGVSPPTAAGQERLADRVLAAAPSVDRRVDNLTLDPLDMPTAEQVQEKLAAGAYDIVHYVGFGQYRGGADQLALQGYGGFQYLDADRFAMRLEEDRLPRVVVLQQVEVPKDVPSRGEPQSVPADLSMFAWGLLRRGVEAVVANQFPLAPQLTVAFNAEFYAQLAAGQSFEMAVQKARSALWQGGEGMHAYLSPAAFVARPGELRLTAPPADSAPLTRVGVMAGHA
jgi:CHAT domain/Trypsin-like peptidase domain